MEFGEAVEIGGLQIAPGDLLHGDQHGVLSIPISIAPEIPRKLKKMLEAERELIDFCRSKTFSFQKLTEKIQHASDQLGTPDKDSK